jgi:hypothetical protein
MVIKELIKEAGKYRLANPTSTFDDIVKHLQVKVPGASVLQLESVAGSHAPTPYPAVHVVTKGTVKPRVPWYTYNASSHHNFTHFYNVTLQGMPTPKAIATISGSTQELVNLLPNPSLTKFENCSGLVIGNVQSGKTANFTGLIARAADSGYNLIIVLSGGNFNDLRCQTQKRLFKDLIDPVNSLSGVKGWHKTTTAHADNSGDVGDVGYDKAWDATTTNCLVVTKKNPTTLEKLREWLETFIPTLSVPVNMLLIDDEADYASLNLLAHAKSIPKSAVKASRINKEIRLILQCVDRNAYIGFTASPFANMFVPPFKDGFNDSAGKPIPTLYPRDFIYLLPEPEGYFGLKRMCTGDLPHWPAHLSYVTEDEANFYRKNTTNPKLDTSHTIKEGLQNAIFDAFIAVGIRFLREKKNRSFHQSMLIHTKETVERMHGILDTTTTFVQQLRGAIHSGGIDKWTKAVYKNFQKRYSVRKKTIKTAPSFSGLIDALKEYFHDPITQLFPEVLEVSSNPEKGSDLQYPSGEPYFVIAIGAMRLSRGFTLEHLYTTYFAREPQQLKSDTLLQQGRWFGFRGKNIDMVTIHLTSSLQEHFWALKEVENDLHDEVRHFQSSNLDPSQFAISVMKAAGQIPTALNKIPKMKKIIYGILQKDYLPKSGAGFPISLEPADKAAHEQNNLNNLESFGELVDDMVDHIGSMPARHANGRYIFENIPLDLVVQFFKKTLSNFPKDPFKKKQLLEYLANRNKHGNECSAWTVVVVGNQPDPKTDQTIKFNKTSSHSFRLAMVNRSRKPGSNDMGAFTQAADFEIGITPSPAMSQTRKHLCGLRDPTNPIMIVYPVDKKSTAGRGREAMATKDHVFTMALGFPPAKLTPAEKVKFNSEKWWNSHLKLDD